MGIKQTIEFHSTNEYFSGFLQELINESGIKASVSQNDKEIVLLLDDNDTITLAAFSTLTTRYLPHSVFLGGIKTVSENTEIQASNFHSSTYNIALCPKCLEKLTNPSSEHYLDDTIKCNHYSNNADKEYADSTTFSAHYAHGDTLLVVDSKKVGELFVMTEDEMRALFSIEKPTIKVTIQDETLKELTSCNFINIKSPYNVRSTLVALNAKESEVPYLFFEDTQALKVVVMQKNVTIIKDAKGLAQELEPLHLLHEPNRFLNISKEAGFKNAIAADMSVENGISFLVKSEDDVKKVISVQKFVLREVFKDMQADSAKQKMLLNFEKKYPKIIEELAAHDEYGMFETLAAILELNGRNFEDVSDKSLEFRGNGGLKIDTYFKEERFDYVSFIGSIMSFKLAGTDEHYLAYSLFEALGDMTILTLSQLKVRTKIENFVMMGSMFENTVLYSRVLSKFQLSNPFFSKAFALDDE